MPAPTATITLLVGAGGGFGRVLQLYSGVSHAMIQIAMQARHLPLLLLAWTLAALMRLATGSATVAMTTAAGIVAPIALQTPEFPRTALRHCHRGRFADLFTRQ